jgi:beta-lactamase superfamily II metal-dependent hydrolase
MSREVAPADDEFEISVIGPGRGESILLHLGAGEWMVVDSCIARGQNQPAALEYLESLGSGTVKGVRMIVATHWHDDHIRGLAQLLEASPNARFACSMAIKENLFLELVSAVGSVSSNTGVDEFKRILEVLQQRRKDGVAPQLVTPQWALERRELLTLEGDHRPFRTRVVALSPSDATVRIALDEIGAFLPKAGAAPVAITRQGPNQTSIVLWVEVGDKRLLLGGDLEHVNVGGRGWLAVLDAHSDTSQATVFKIPHHGSSNADCENVWTRMIRSDCFAVLTPYNAGAKLPSAKDVERIVNRTANAFSTAAHTALPRRDPLTEKKLKQMVKKRQVLAGAAGHVRMRWKGGTESVTPTVELFNGAFKLSSAA